MGGLGFVGYKVGQQLNRLANELPKYEDNIKDKIGRMKPKQANAITKVTKVVGDVGKHDHARAGQGRSRRSGSSPSPTSPRQVAKAVGPYLEGLGSAFIILILLLYLMINRENMSDRLIRLFGRGKISLTTRTIEEVGQRISKYLVMFATMNSAYGLVDRAGPLGDRRALRAALGRSWRRASGSSPTPGRPRRSPCRCCSRSRAPRAWIKPLEVLALFAVLEIAGEHGPGADDLRQDDRGLGPGAAGGRDVLDLALGGARAPAVDPPDGLPGGPGQVRAEPGLLRHVPPRGGRPRPRRPVLPAAPGDGPGRRHRGDRRGPEEAPQGRGLRQGAGPDPVDGRARLRPRRHRRARAGVHPPGDAGRPRGPRGRARDRPGLALRGVRGAAAAAGGRASRRPTAGRRSWPCRPTTPPTSWS